MQNVNQRDALPPMCMGECVGRTYFVIDFAPLKAKIRCFKRLLRDGNCYLAKVILILPFYVCVLLSTASGILLFCIVSTWATIHVHSLFHFLSCYAMIRRNHAKQDFVNIFFKMFRVNSLSLEWWCFIPHVCVLGLFSKKYCKNTVRCRVATWHSSSEICYYYKYAGNGFGVWSDLPVLSHD